ncbi:MAG: glycosyltransferase family 2 protein [Acidimicrobiales bacterium]|nr:glycosyltransferase family 2 protein [Acidimicrobiales bacterium]
MALCTYQGAAWLEEMLESIAAQTRLPDELVIQDDASTDATAEVVAAFARTAPFPVRFEVNDRRVGSTANFERVLERTTGSFVALADQDDRWYPEKLDHLVRILDDDPILTLTFSDAELLDADGAPTGARLWRQRRIHHLLAAHEIVPGPQFARRALSTGCTMVVRRRVLDAALPFPQCLDDPVAPMRHDRWLSLVAAAVGTVRAVPEPLLGFRVHPDQQTGVLATRTLAARLLAAAGAAMAGDDAVRHDEHLARARQVGEAAERAERLGDFEEADELRLVARHHVQRADLGPTRSARFATVLGEARTGGYDRSLLGAAAIGADLARALRPPR